jgi:hypothetical protein
MPVPARSLLAIPFACALLLASCTVPPPPEYGPIRFTDRPQLKLSVDSVDLRDTFDPAPDGPNIERSFPVTPQSAAEDWAHDRLSPAGGAGRAVFTIIDASVTEVDLPRTGGIAGLFTSEPTKRYDIKLVASLEIDNAEGLAVRTAAVTAVRSQSILNGASPNQREQIYYDMTKTLMADFDAKMESDVRATFLPYIQP